MRFHKVSGCGLLLQLALPMQFLLLAVNSLVLAGKSVTLLAGG
jgi:hypothetical protein